MAISWFQSITRTTRRLLWQQTSGHHNPMTNGDFGRLLMRPTPHMRALHTLSLWQVITDRQSDSHYRLVAVSHTRKCKTGHAHTHTHTHTARQLWRRTPPSTSGMRLLHVPVFSALHYLQGPLKLLASGKQCHKHQASPELWTFCQTTALSCFHVS